jgi:hypothetical protein
MEIRLRTKRWTGVIEIKRAGDDRMNWSARADARREERRQYRDALCRHDDVAALLRLSLQECFSNIAELMEEQIASSGHQIDSTYDHEALRADIKKQSYPSAELKVVIERPKPNRDDTQIVCTTNGLNVQNERHEWQRKYDLSMSFSHGAVYRTVSDTGAPSGELSLPALVDDLLEQFADCLA